MDTELITLEIDGQSVSVPAGTTIFEAAKAAGIEIPNLCYLKELGPYGACGVCVVEVENCPKMLRACSAKVAPGMVVHFRRAWWSTRRAKRRSPRASSRSSC